MKHLLIFLLSLSALASYGQTSMSFTNLSTEFQAPGRGAEEWNGLHTWDNVTYCEVPNGTTASLNYYFRFRWNLLEDVTQGSYNWAPFDLQIDSAIANGKMFSFGLMSVCSTCDTMVYPKYLHTQMQAETTNSRDWKNSGGVWIPNWNSNNYLGRWKALLTALASHIASSSYLGVSYSKAIYYVDVRGYGDFNEWHNYPYSGATPTGRVATSASLDSLISYAGQAWWTYPLELSIATFDHGDASVIPLDVTLYAINYKNGFGPLGIRTDAWGDSTNDDIMKSNPYSYGGINFKDTIVGRWKSAPFTGELSSAQPIPPGGTRYSDLSREFGIYHPTSFGNGNYYSNVSDANLQANIRAASAQSGYRLQPQSGTTTTNPTISGGLNVTINWQNIGIAPPYKHWAVNYELRDPTTHAVKWSGISLFETKLFLPSGSTTAIVDNMGLGSCPAGTWDLYMIFRDPSGYNNPLPLAITGRQSDGSYLLRAGVVVTAGITPCPTCLGHYLKYGKLSN